MLRNSSMTITVTKGFKKVPKKSLQRVEIGSNVQQIKKLVQRYEIGAHVPKEYGGRVK